MPHEVDHRPDLRVGSALVLAVAVGVRLWVAGAVLAAFVGTVNDAGTARRR